MRDRSKPRVPVDLITGEPIVERVPEPPTAEQAASVQRWLAAETVPEIKSRERLSTLHTAYEAWATANTPNAIADVHQLRAQLLDHGCETNGDERNIHGFPVDTIMHVALTKPADFSPSVLQMFEAQRQYRLEQRQK